MPSSFEQLFKTDRRAQWKLLKNKHAKAITKAKVDFDQKLGPALDKYQTQVEKLTKLTGKVELNSMQVQPVLEAATALKTTVGVYHDLVKKIEEPARKELAGVLAAIEGDIKSWGDLAVGTMGSPAKGTTDAQKAAAHEMITTLDNIRSMCLMVVTRGPRAVEYYKGQKRMGAAALASHMVETARLAGSASHELANASQQVIAGTNYDFFKTRAVAAAPLIHNARLAADMFKSKWAINTDPEMTYCADVDAKCLKENQDQIAADFDFVVTLVGKLP